MSKPISLTLSLSLFLGFSLACAPYAVSQDSAQTSVKDDIDKELVDSELGSADEEAPEAEYPYPGAKEEGIVSAKDEAAEIEMAPTVQNSGPGERPVSIDKDSGDYYYSTENAKPVPVARPGDRNPESVTDHGEYNYSTNVKPPEFSKRPGVEEPTQILSSGEFKYKTEKSPTTATASFRVGFFGPPGLQNEKTKSTFQDIYTRDQLPVLFGDYEIPISRSLGHIGLKFGSGIFLAQGKGVFVNPDPANRRPDDVPTEQYSFFMFPNQITAQYRFQYSDNQAIVPYVEGGAGYFTFVEFRDDSSTPRIGGALTTVLAGGANFLMDWLDPEAIGRLDTDYGINHVYLTTEFRQIVGLNKSYDFTSSVFNAGFLLQF